MVSKPKVEIIKKEFGVTDEKLEKLGIIAPTPKIVSTRLNEKEFKLLNKLSYSSGKSKSDITRKCVDKIINNDPDIKSIINAGCELDKLYKLENKKIQKKKVVTFKIPIPIYKKLVKVSRNKCIPVSRLIRYYLLTELEITNLKERSQNIK